MRPWAVSLLVLSCAFVAIVASAAPQLLRLGDAPAELASNAGPGGPLFVAPGGDLPRAEAAGLVGPWAATTTHVDVALHAVAGGAFVIDSLFSLEGPVPGQAVVVIPDRVPDADAGVSVHYRFWSGDEPPVDDRAPSVCAAFGPAAPTGGGACSTWPLQVQVTVMAADEAEAVDPVVVGGFRFLPA